MTITHAEMPLGFPWIVIASRSSERSEEAAWQSHLGDAGRSWAIGLPGGVSLRGTTVPKQSLSCEPGKAHLKSIAKVKLRYAQ